MGYPIILITLASLVYWTGMSIDKACGILAFFTGLELSKSQADSLLSQLATDWRVEYNAIAELVASAAILYIMIVVCQLDGRQK